MKGVVPLAPKNPLFLPGRRDVRRRARDTVVVLKCVARSSARPTSNRLRVLKLNTPLIVLLAAGVVLAAAITVASAAVPSPGKYRDFKVYTESAPDPADAKRIVATMRWLNQGATALD